MPMFSIIIGTGETPKGYELYGRCTNAMEFVGLKGKVNIHLHGEWWKIIPVEVFHLYLINLYANEEPPTVTMSI